MQHLLLVKSSRGSACAGGTLQVKVNLKEYPVFWAALLAAQHGAHLKNISTVEQLIDKVFHFKVTVYPQDRFGAVVMEQETFTWFELKYGTNQTRTV